MNDNTILRIKVPANLYESVKKQLTITEAKKGTHNLGAGMELVKEKKMKTPKDEMKKVEEEKQEEGYMGTDYASSEDMAVDMVKKGIKEKNNSMEKKTHTLAELKKAKDALDEKINKMEMASKAPMNEDATEILMQLANTITDPDIINAIGRKLNMNSNELLNFFAGGTTLGTLGALLKRAANKDKERAKQG